MYWIISCNLPAFLPSTSLFPQGIQWAQLFNPLKTPESMETDAETFMMYPIVHPLITKSLSCYARLHYQAHWSVKWVNACCEILFFYCYQSIKFKQHLFWSPFFLPYKNGFFNRFQSWALTVHTVLSTKPNAHIGFYGHSCFFVTDIIRLELSE